MYLEVVFEVRLTEKHSVAVLMWTTELLCVLVRVHVSAQLLLGSKRLITTLQSKNTRCESKLFTYQHLLFSYNTPPLGLQQTSVTTAKH